MKILKPTEHGKEDGIGKLGGKKRHGQWDDRRDDGRVVGGDRAGVGLQASAVSRAMISRFSLAILVMIVFGSLADGAWADDPSPLVLADNSANFALRGHLSILDDDHGDLDIGAVANSGSFQERPANALERNYTNGAIWYKFTVIRSQAMPADWILAIGDPFIDDIRVFAPAKGGGWRENRLGRHVPSGQLPLAARQHVVMLDLPENVPTTIYVRLASKDEIQFESALWRPNALMFEEIRRSTIMGMFFSVLAIIVIIYTLFGIWLRDLSMLTYAVYIFTFALFSISHTGIAAILFPGTAGSNLLTGIGVLGNVAALIFMWDRALDMRRHYPVIHRVYMFGCTAALGSLLMVPTSLYVFMIKPTFIVTMVVTIVSLCLAGGLLLRRKGGYFVKYYVIAFIPFLFFSVGHVVEILYPTVDILYVRPMGALAMLIHIVILSIALVHRIGRLQQEKLRGDAELAMARSAMREHRNFVTMLSHQLRTPLAIIAAAIDLLNIKHPNSDEAAKIRRAVLRMRDLITDVLAEGRLAEAGATPDRRAVALVPLLQALCDAHRDSSDHDFRLKCAADTAVVEGDRAMLEILFANLLENAVKYSSPTGEVRVGVTHDHGDVLVMVADDGPGIPADEVDLVFEKYYRSPTAPSNVGSGLGLFMVRQIAERHGGTVSLMTVPGQGASFTIRLPSERVTASAKV